MDYDLRRLQRLAENDSSYQRDYVVAYCRSIGAEFGGNIKSRWESLFLAKSYARQEYDRGRMLRRLEANRIRRDRWFLRRGKHHPKKNLIVSGEWFKYYLMWDGEKHVIVDTTAFIQSKIKNKDDWLEMAVNEPRYGGY